MHKKFFTFAVPLLGAAVLVGAGFSAWVFQGSGSAGITGTISVTPAIDEELSDNKTITITKGATEANNDEEYMSALNLAGDGIMGTVEIPKIGITLPIYHTTDEEVLEKAAGHLEGSSLPVGGESTHAVISAHRGLPSASLFTDLDLLEEGDHFLIHVLNNSLSVFLSLRYPEAESLTEVLGVEWSWAGIAVSLLVLVVSLRLLWKCNYRTDWKRSEV